MKFDIKRLLRSIAIPLLIGGIAGFLTRTGTQTYATMAKPPLSPPAIVFPIVWTLLYTLMGISYYLIGSQKGSAETAKAVTIAVIALLRHFKFIVNLRFKGLQNSAGRILNGIQ